MFRGIPLDLFAEAVLPFLQRTEIFDVCKIVPGLFQKSRTWKELVFSCLPFYSLPDPQDRKYREFLRRRYSTRRNWLNWKKTQSLSAVPNSDFDATRVRTDSNHIVMCRDHLRKESFLEFYDMDCKLIRRTPTFGYCHSFDFMCGKVLTGSRAGVDIWSASKKITSTSYFVEDAVLQDRAESFVFVNQGKLYEADTEIPSSALFLSRVPTSSRLYLCETTAHNQVVGYAKDMIVFWDSRQSTSTRTYLRKSSDSTVCTAGDTAIFYYNESSVTLLDSRYNRKQNIYRCASNSIINKVMWTPDAWYISLELECLLQSKKEIMEPLSLEISRLYPTFFHLTDKYLVFFSDDAQQTFLSSLCF